MGEMLAMMQGGQDRTGFADMADQYAYEQPDNRLAALKKAMEEGQGGGEEGGETGGNIGEIGGGEEDDLSIMQLLFGDDEGSFTSDSAVGENALLFGAPPVGAAVGSALKNKLFGEGKVTKEMIEQAGKTTAGGGKSFAKYFARRAPAMLAKRGAVAATGVGALPAALSILPEAAYMYADYKYPDQVDAFEKKVGGGIKAGAETVGSGLQSGVDYLQSFMPESDYVDDRTDEEKEYHEAIGSYYNPYRETNNEGGRVEMQQGGMPGGMAMPGLLGVASGSSGNLFDNYTPNPSAVPGPNYGPPLGRPPMQGDPGYNPTPGLGYMQPELMDFQPSPMQSANYDVANYLGGPDPYAVAYNPYVDMGGSAYDNYGLGMKQEDIDKVFADTDKFSLAAQEAKRKAAEAAAAAAKKKQNTGGGHAGEGGGGSSGGGGKSCFVEGTPVEMADGTTKEITNIKVGDETRGGIVEVTMQCLPARIYNYKDVLVSGSHWVIEDNQFVAVEDSKHGVLTDRIEPVYTLKTSKNRIWIYGIEFGDFETGSDEDWEPHFEAVRQKLNKELSEKTT
jgi:hypothetical protein